MRNDPGGREGSFGPAPRLLSVGAMAFLPVAPADLIELGRKLQTLGRKLQKEVAHGQ